MEQNRGLGGDSAGWMLCSGLVGLNERFYLVTVLIGGGVLDKWCVLRLIMGGLRSVFVTGMVKYSVDGFDMKGPFLKGNRF